MSEHPFHPEYLRPVDSLHMPDPRSVGFVIYDSLSRDWRPLQIGDLHESVSRHVLHKQVPEGIKINFDTARNLYIFAFYVYRFYPVAEHHALICLELALREQYGSEIPKTYYERSNHPTLKPLLRYAVDKGYVRNEGFRRWNEHAEIKARMRYELEKLDEMRQKGIEKMELDYSEVVITVADRNLSYINQLIEALPVLRNEYAHGTKMLHNRVLGTIQVVSEIINQIFP